MARSKSMTRTREEILELYRLHLNGESLAQIGHRIGVSVERVRQIFEDQGLPRLSQSQKAAQNRLETAKKVEAARDQIIALYKRHGTVDDVLARLSPRLPRKPVTKVIDEIPNREAYRRQSKARTYSREELISDLQRARDHAGEPLSGMTYQEIAPGFGLAAFATIIRFFEMEDPDQPWQAALKAAGVKSNPARGRRANAITPEQCIEAVMACLEEHGGKRVSYPVYAKWATANHQISGASVRKLLGWNPAVEAALDGLASGVR